ncbi:hypothetical protein J5N97_006486 [Dioscorea zingiberensis]|uniref:Non-structural maintenance of chromosomes element 4 n=1 Tax=Dioscorea zingiberensis TaxID=325984 RepID=A0A9D5DA10_9LILI|nr:hypothetical protein J5N97_006486 [Dioscorea zingiberensis]
MERGVKRKLGSGKGATQLGEPLGSLVLVDERRVLRSCYLTVKNIISEEGERITNGSSEKFQSIMSQVESLHKLVQKPREQVSDAEALLDIANTLVTSVRSQNNGMTPSDFVTSLMKNFRKRNSPNMTIWVDVGLIVTPILRTFPGCSTMVGSLNTEIKHRGKSTVRRKRSRPAWRTCPKELAGTKENIIETDKNMITMFDLLRKNKNIRLENLVLNRSSFAQTVENIFALSFLIKDGRVAIAVDVNGHHLVSPKNGPAASSVIAGDVSYSHFVFRFDFSDWKLMMNIVKEGEEVMPHRNIKPENPFHGNSQPKWNHGLPIRGQLQEPKEEGFY